MDDDAETMPYTVDIEAIRRTLAAIPEETKQFYELRAEFSKAVHLMNKEGIQSHIEAIEAFVEWMIDKENPVLKVKCLSAFARCYRELGLDKQAGRVKGIREELILKYK